MSPVASANPLLYAIHGFTLSPFSSALITIKLIGKVKWFNNKSGYGFITMLSDGDLKNKDIFAHHSSIDVKEDLYKYLVQGEYVELKIGKLEKVDDNNRSHEVQATEITGIMGGDLMCETRNKNKDTTRSSEGYTKVKRNQKK